MPPAPALFSTTTVHPVDFGELLRHQPRDEIGAAARRERHDQADRLRRIGLGGAGAARATAASAATIKRIMTFLLLFSSERQPTARRASSSEYLRSRGPAFITWPGNGRPMTASTRRATAISASRSMPVSKPDSSSR